jgi:ankyrin repeat protein
MRFARLRLAICGSLLAAPLMLAAPGVFAIDALPDLVNAGDRAAAVELISSGSDVNELSVDGTTALHWAVYRKDLELVQMLLDEDADPNIRNDYGASPMTVASEHGDFAIMQALVEAGGDIESPNDEGQTLLMAVARTGRLDTAKLLLEKGANANAVESWGGQSALMWAASQQQPEMIALLLEHGADVNARGKDHDWPRFVTSEPRTKPLDLGGFTPLLYAAREGCVACVTALLDGGADIDMPDLWGQTPLILATLNLHYDTANVLIERGADIKRWDWWGRTALYNAIDLHLMTSSTRGDLPSTDTLTALDIARTLLEKGAYVDMRLKAEPPFRGGDRGYTDGSADSRVVSAGSTALHKAAKAGDVEAVKLLLEFGANVHARNVLFEVTPILGAAGVWRVYGIFREGPLSGEFTTAAQAAEVVKLLMEKGADIHDVAANGQNAAHGAAKAGWNEVVQLAFDNGVDLAATDVGGLTPRDLAIMKGHQDTAALIDELLAKKAP